MVFLFFCHGSGISLFGILGFFFYHFGSQDAPSFFGSSYSLGFLFLNKLFIYLLFIIYFVNNNSTFDLECLKIQKMLETLCSQIYREGLHFWYRHLWKVKFKPFTKQRDVMVTENVLASGFTFKNTMIARSTFHSLWLGGTNHKKMKFWCY